MSVCVCVELQERRTSVIREYVCDGDKEEERGGERERESVCVCVCVCDSASVQK